MLKIKFKIEKMPYFFPFTISMATPGALQKKGNVPDVTQLL